MNWIGSGLIPLLIYADFGGSSPSNSFLLLDGSNFLLLDSSFFLLL